MPVCTDSSHPRQPLLPALLIAFRRLLPAALRLAGARRAAALIRDFARDFTGDLAGRLPAAVSDLAAFAGLALRAPLARRVVFLASVLAGRGSSTVHPLDHVHGAFLW